MEEKLLKLEETAGEYKIAINVGTSWTKVAYFNSVTQQPELMHLGREQVLIPSLFNVDPVSGKVWIGDEALDRLEDNPRSLKIRLGQGFWFRRRNVDPMGLLTTRARRNVDPMGLLTTRARRNVDPKVLLTTLFSEIRERAGRDIPCFDNVPPTAVRLTFTYANPRIERNLLKAAAQAAGFKTVELVSEPEAAVRAWQATVSDDHYRDAIVLDCGGGTVDWCYIHRTESGMFRQVPVLAPGEVGIGGEEVDEGLVGLVISKLPPLVHRQDAFNTEVLRQRCRELKERYCRGLPLPKIEVDGHPVEPIELEGSEIQTVIDETFITPVCNAFKPYLDKVKETTEREDPAVLLVGGSARLKGLEEALERECSCQVFKWHRSEFATVLGAVL